MNAVSDAAAYAPFHFRRPRADVLRRMNHLDVTVHRANGVVTISISEAAIEQAAKPIAADSNEESYTITDRDEFLNAVATGIDHGKRQREIRHIRAAHTYSPCDQISGRRRMRRGIDGKPLPACGIVFDMDPRAVGGLEHVTYEMLQLHRLWERAWLNPKPIRLHVQQQDMEVVNNALMESTLVHARNIFDFFELMRRPPHGSGVRKAKEDDIIAEDYDFPAAKIGIPDAIRVRMNKEIAHLTYARVGRSPAQKMWNFADLLPPVFAKCRSFAEHVATTTPALLIEPNATRLLFLRSIPDDAVVTPAQSFRSSSAEFPESEI